MRWFQMNDRHWINLEHVSTIEFSPDERRDANDDQNDAGRFLLIFANGKSNYYKPEQALYHRLVWAIQRAHAVKP